VALVLCGVARRLRTFPHGISKSARLGIGKACVVVLVLVVCVASGLVYAATTWSVQAKLERAAAVVSNGAAKQDRSESIHSAAAPQQKVSGHARILPSGGAEVTWQDPSGRIVYRNDPTAAETTVTRGTQLPEGASSIGLKVASEPE
jgi:hypothetical protein